MTTQRYKVGTKNTINNFIVWNTHPIDDSITPYSYQQAAQAKAMLNLRYRNTIKEVIMEEMTEQDLLISDEV